MSWNSPFSSPRVYRKGVIESPIGSPSVYRKSVRESDTGTDDDYARIDTGSPASSDSIYASKRDSEEDKVMEDVALKCKHKVEKELPPCKRCGASTQYIPIPVPVPIPVPIPTMWTAQEAMKFYASQPGSEQALAKLRIFPRNLWPFLNTAALMWPLVAGASESVSTQFNDLESQTVVAQAVVPNAEYETVTLSTVDMDESDAIVESPQVPQDDGDISGYLESENRYDDSSTSSTETDDSEYNERRKSCVTRVYNVNGRDGARESDDALPSSNLSSCDEEDGRASREDLTSSCTSDTDSDDTGTDQKSKKFSKVFVVNKDMDSSSHHSSSSDTDSSDNDTDTELDCTVILQNVKYIPEDDQEEVEAKDVLDNNENKVEDKNSDVTADEDLEDDKTEGSSANLSDLLTPSEPEESVELDDRQGSVSSEAKDDVQIRSEGAVNVVGEFVSEKSSSSCCGGVRASAPGVSVTLEPTDVSGAGRHAARYTSLVMITQEPSAAPYQQVSVVTSDTTRFVADNDVVVQHTNWQEEDGDRYEDDPPGELEKGFVLIWWGLEKSLVVSMN